jgi:GNAT superfamily N-acetyltransferase
MVTPLISSILKKAGSPLTITNRAVQIGDTSALATFRAGLSSDTVYNRYFAPFQLSQHALAEWAEHLIQRHPSRQWSWVATDGNRIVGLLELVPDPIDQCQAEMGVVVTDDYQQRGIGTALGWYALAIARRWGIRHVVACMLAENRGAQKFIRNLETPCLWQDDGELRLVTMTL